MSNTKSSAALKIILIIAAVAIIAGASITLSKFSTTSDDENFLINEQKRLYDIKKLRLNNKELDRCLKDVEETYSLSWDEACKKVGKGPDCVLGPGPGQKIGERRQKLEERCYNRFTTK